MKKLYDEKLVYRYHPSPIGELLIAGNEEGLHLIGFPEGKGKVLPSDEWVKDPRCLPEVEAQLQEYFAGERKEFDLKLCPHGTEFQLQVLNALLQIPYGSTSSYVEIAQEDWPTQGCKGGRFREWSKSDTYHHSLSPGHRCGRQSHRIWWWIANEAISISA